MLSIVTLVVLLLGGVSPNDVANGGPSVVTTGAVLAVLGLPGRNRIGMHAVPTAELDERGAGLVLSENRDDLHLGEAGLPLCRQAPPDHGAAAGNDFILRAH
jgi:hypothetical protein